jgi:hypothetical protein
MYAILVVVGGTLANLLIAAMFAARVIAPAWASPLGFAGTAMAIPLAAAAVVAVRSGAGIWDVALPLVFVAYAVLEVLLDGVLHLDFRSTAWLWPYLLLYYAGQWAIIGAAFRASREGGVVVLVTYFVCLAATLFSFVRVGHGQP